MVTGNYDTISAGAGEKISVGGYGDVITGSVDQITLSGSNSTITVQGNGDQLLATGTNDKIIDNRADGTSFVDSWNSTGAETSTIYSGKNGTGSIIGGNGYSGSGTGAALPGGYGYFGSGGGYGFAGSQSKVTTAVGSNIGSIAQYDLAQGNTTAAAIAEAALLQANGIATSTPTAGTGSAVLEGAKWDQQVVTWSLADSQGTNAAPFSGYMDSSYESTVQEAFNAWAAADPGITFKEVSDSSQSDIRLGFGNFNTTTSGVVGYTSYQSSNGQMSPDAIVRIEDPTQNALVTGANGQQTYAGTDATLLQVLEHEIGHTLGFADNTDSNSIMYYELTSSNQSLDSTDLNGMSSLYGSGSNASASSSTSVNQLIQAMATFNTGSGAATTSLVPAALLANSMTLAPSATMH